MENYICYICQILNCRCPANESGYCDYKDLSGKRCGRTTSYSNMLLCPYCSLKTNKCSICLGEINQEYLLLERSFLNRSIQDLQKKLEHPETTEEFYRKRSFNDLYPLGPGGYKKRGLKTRTDEVLLEETKTLINNVIKDYEGKVNKINILLGE